MSLSLSKHITALKPSPTLAMVSAIAQRKLEGKETIAFNIGEPDFDTPKFINEAIKNAIDNGYTRYVEVKGIKPLRIEISKKLKEENNLDYNEDQIVVTTGAKQALFNVVMTLINKGDEIIIPKPCWVSYEEMVTSVGGKCIFLETDEYFMPDLKQLEEMITPKTKAIILNTPNNPTGAVYDRKTLEKIAQLAVEHQFYVISDEIYEKLIYTNKELVSIGSLNKEILEQTITINGFAKAFAMTGYRIGYLAAPNHIAKAIANLQGHMTSNSTTPVQYGAVVALQEGKESIEFMVKEFSKRRELCFKLLDDIEGITYSKVEGAFYIMLNVKNYFNKKYQNYTINNADDLSLYLLDNASIALVSGKAFQAPEYLRFSYSNSIENITKGLLALKEALSLLK
ncbi:pyridoxal phosphate-dependent aminotransferase [Mycoplasma sp. P36-A1]|uniref:pyridoxal phosphate-dependent aminotransferase n=1 Tax=Mycoplasma sp. P36-A1 TaxID=3252900 RepID=UPI003C301893